MKFRATRLILCLVVVGSIPCALAQDESDVRHSFGCSSTQAESTFSSDLKHPSKVRVVAVTDKDEVERASSGAFHTLYSKIDTTKYKFGRVDFYVQQEKQKDPDAFGGYLPLSIYIKTNAADGRWWKIVADGEDVAQDFLSADVHRDSDETPRPVTILPATGDRTIPLFDVQWNRLEQQAWTNDYETHLLVDLRSEPPQVLADLACDSITAHGVCGG